MGSSSDWLAPLLGITVLGLGAVFILPKVMGKEENGFGIPPIEEEQPVKGFTVTREQAEEIARALDEKKQREAFQIGREQDDIYLITDEDFSKLDIGRKEKSWLNEERRLRDARLSRVVYGDVPNGNMPAPVFAGAGYHTISPYGQGPARELSRLPGFSDQSRVNSRINTLNLY